MWLFKDSIYFCSDCMQTGTRGGSRISHRRRRPRRRGLGSRGGYVSKILYVKTKEPGPLGRRAPGTPPRSANGHLKYLIDKRTLTHSGSKLLKRSHTNQRRAIVYYFCATSASFLFSRRVISFFHSPSIYLFLPAPFLFSWHQIGACRLLWQLGIYNYRKDNTAEWLFDTKLASAGDCAAALKAIVKENR